MYNQQQIRMVDKTVAEITRQAGILNIEVEKFAHIADPTAQEYKGVNDSIEVHNNAMAEITKLIHRPDTVHAAIWDFAFDRLCHAFSNLMEQYTQVNNKHNDKQQSDFAKILEAKKHTSEEVQEVKEETKEVVKEEVQEEETKEETAKTEAIETKEETKEVQEVQEEVKETVSDKTEKHQIDMNAKCDIVKHCTDGAVNTPAEALDMCKQNGMRVVHTHNNKV